MITAGIDCGNMNTKVVILKDGEVVAKSMVLSGFDQKSAIQVAFNQALAETGIVKEEVDHVTATGAGRNEVVFADTRLTEVGAAARGGHKLCPSARIIVDIGAEEGRAIKIDDSGKVLDFVLNEKCAAGAGSFVESMARMLQVSTEEMGAMSLKATKDVPMNTQCVVFAESEVISLIHNNHSKEDIARAVHDGIAGRLTSMVRKLGIAPNCFLVGGVAYNPGFIQCLKDELQVDITVAKEPIFVPALGAAIYAADDKK